MSDLSFTVYRHPLLDSNMSLKQVCDLLFTAYRHPLPDTNTEIYSACVICLSQLTGIPYQTETQKSIVHV